jgi:hypothetical protein
MSDCLLRLLPQITYSDYLLRLLPQIACLDCLPMPKALSLNKRHLLDSFPPSSLSFSMFSFLNEQHSFSTKDLARNNPVNRLYT